MTEKDAEKLGFREWTTHYEKEQEADRLKVDHVINTMGQLGSGLSRLEALMESWIETQRSVTTRINRPWQWGVVVSVFMGMFAMSAMFGTMATLVVTPIHTSISNQEIAHARDVERNLALHMWFRETISEIQVEAAKTQIDVEWMKLMEERVNGRIHAGIMGVNP